MTELGRGNLAKMVVDYAAPVNYQLPLNDARVPLNPLLGQALHLEFLGAIHCVHCGRATKKSFNQGYCYPCFRKLAQCDTCIIKPEQCHFDQGTCREPDWAQSHCFVDHVVYLANASGLKVGITRASQMPTRWIDQGAVQALPILRVHSRYQSGLVEDVIRQHVADKTNWRAMLKNQTAPLDLPAERDRLLAECASEIAALRERFGVQAIQPVTDAETLTIDYPVHEYPTKISTHNFDKAPAVTGTLMGIKGQYLLFDTGVINIRKFGGYQVALHAA